MDAGVGDWTRRSLIGWGPDPFAGAWSAGDWFRILPGSATRRFAGSGRFRSADVPAARRGRHRRGPGCGSGMRSCGSLVWSSSGQTGCGSPRSISIIAAEVRSRAKADFFSSGSVSAQGRVNSFCSTRRPELDGRSASRPARFAGRRCWCGSIPPIAAPRRAGNPPAPRRRRHAIRTGRLVQSLRLQSGNQMLTHRPEQLSPLADDQAVFGDQPRGHGLAVR